MSDIKGKLGKTVIFLCSMIIVFEIMIIIYYYNFLEKQLFNERKALFTQFVDKVSESVNYKIQIFWNHTDIFEKLIHKKQFNDEEMLFDTLNEIKYIAGLNDGIVMTFNEEGCFHTSDGHEGRMCEPLVDKNTQNKHQLFIVNLPYKKNSETYFLMVNQLEKNIVIDEKNKITQVAMAVNIDSLKELFTSEGFKDRSYTFLSDKEGKILYKNTYNNDFLDGYNIFSSIATSSKMVSQGTTKEIENDLKNNKKIAYEIEYQDENWFVANGNINSVECDLMIFVPSKLISADTALISQGTTYVLIAILVLFAMLCYTIYVFVRINIKRDRKMIAQQKQVNELLEKQAQAADSANKAKSRFLSYMSHDIRTPMNGIMGMTDIAVKNIDKKDKVYECLHKIAHSSKHLLSLLNDVLDMSRIESGKVAIENNPMNIKLLVENCSSIMEGQIITRELKFVRDFSDIKYPNVFGDELHLRQILINILGNAIKFTPDGGKVVFSVQEEVVDEDTVEYLFEIEDTGVGMSEEFLKRIWNPFEQEEGRGNIKCQGTGLGMAITKQFVDMMKGQIYVVSELEKGSKFTLKLRFAIDKEERLEEELQDEDVDITNMRILLVEDNELNREIAQEVLAERGAKVDSVENGKEAVESFISSEPHTYEVIIMDVMMPIMDGITATQCIRNSNHLQAKTIPIIAMTANAFEEDIKRTKEAGMNTHISKPLNPDMLFIELAHIRRNNLK